MPLLTVEMLHDASEGVAVRRDEDHLAFLELRHDDVIPVGEGAGDGPAMGTFKHLFPHETTIIEYIFQNANGVVSFAWKQESRSFQYKPALVFNGHTTKSTIWGDLPNTLSWGLRPDPGL